MVTLLRTRSPINIPSMAYMDHGNGLLRIVNVIEHPIISHPQAPAVTACQFESTGRARLVREGEQGVSDSAIDLWR